MDRDVEKDCSKEYFVDTLRRIADSIEGGDRLRIQVSGTRVSIPGRARLSIEHEAEGGDHELELQLSWSSED